MALQLPRGFYRYDLALLDASTGLPGALVGGTYPQQLTMKYNSTSYDIQGGDIRLEQGQTDQEYQLTLTTADTPLAILAAMFAAVVTTSGTGGEAISTLPLNTAAGQPFFRFRAQLKDNSGGHTVYRFPKVQAAGFPSITANQGAYAVPSVDMVAFPATDAVTSAAGPPVEYATAVDDLLQIEQAATFAALA